MTGPSTVTPRGAINVETTRVALGGQCGRQLCKVRVLAQQAGVDGERHFTVRYIYLKFGLLLNLSAAQQAVRGTSR